MAEAIVDISELAQAIKSAVEETAPVKQVHISRYVATTPFNPTGDKRRVKLTREVFQNGIRVQPEFLHTEEIELLNKVKPGRYIGRRVEVIERGEGEEKNLEFRYRNQSIEQRLELKNHFRNFAEMLRLIVAEQDDKTEKKSK